MYQERTIKEAIGGNRSLKEPWKKNPVSEEFWHEYIQGEGMKKAFEEYCRPYRFPAKMRVSWFVTNHMYLIPKPILEVRKKLRGGGVSKNQHKTSKNIWAYRTGRKVVHLC